MSGATIGGIAGAALGFVVGGPTGAQVGWMVGSVAGGMLLAEGTQGPRLEDLQVQVSSYGAPIPKVYGMARIAGNVFWKTDLAEHEHEESAKGGPEATTYSYTFSCAVGLCEGTIAGVRRIWANKKLVYDASVGNTGAVQDAAIHEMRVYPGDEAQTADPLIVAHQGSAPGYRGLAYVVFEDFNVADFGNRPPQFEFEVAKAGTLALPAVTSMGSAGQDAAVDPNTRYIWSVKSNIPNIVSVYVTDSVSKALVKQIDVVPSVLSGSRGDSICYVAITDEFWVANENGTNILIYSAAAMAFKQELDFGLSWYGLIRYDPTYHKVWLKRTNVGISAQVINPVTRTALATISLIGGSSDGDIAFLPDGTAAVVSDGHVGICDRVSYSQIADYASASIGVGCRMHYDASRNRLIVVSGPSSDYVTIDLASGTLTVHTLSPGPNPPANHSEHLRTVLAHQRNDRYYFIGTLAGLQWTLHTVNPDTFVTERTVLASGPSLGGLGTMFEVPDTPDYFIHTDGLAAYRIPLLDKLTPTATTLSAIVSDLCTRTGLVAGDLNVIALTDVVDGYMVANQMTARAAIEPLQVAYYFDAVESDNVLKFVKRGGAVAMTIPEADRAAHEPGEQLPDGLSIVRADELEVPAHVDVEYFDRDGDYQIGSQYERRVTRNSNGVRNLRLPIVMDGAKAKQIAMVNLYAAWLTQRYRFQTSRKYAQLEPTDVVVLPTASATYTARILPKREGANGVIEWEALAEDSAIYSQVGIAGESGYVPQTINIPGASMLRLLDIAMLRDVDDDAGFYVAACGVGGSSWRGARLYKSADGGATYAEIMALTAAATIGAAQTALGNFAGGNIFDELNSVTVLLHHGALTSATEAQVLNGANLAVLGSEVIQFKTPTLIATNTYALTGLLRGRRGTEWAMGTHTAGDRFVLASTTTWRRADSATGEIGLTRTYKAPPFGTLLAAASAQDFTNSAAGLKPYAPVLIGGGKEANGDITVKWVRRGRIGGEWRDAVDVPLGEASESYEVEIIGVSGAAVRTLTGLTAPTATYTAAQQTADFGLAWSQIGGDGANSSWSFANATRVVVADLGGTLYAGTQGSAQGDAEVWRWNNTTSTWTQIGGDGLNSGWNATNAAGVSALGYNPANGKVYAVVGMSAGTPPDVWEWNGSGWTRIGGNSLNSSWTSNLTANSASLVIYNGDLVAGLGGTGAGDSEVWQWNGSTWTKIGGDGVNGSWTAPYFATALAVFGADLYCGTGSTAAGDGDVWKYNGSTWTQVGGDALNSSWAAATYQRVLCLATHASKLYAGLGTGSGNGELWEYNGSTWTKVAGDGLNSSWSMRSVQSLLSHSNGRLYAGSGGISAGDGEVWEQIGTTWSRLGGDGVNGSWNTNYEFAWSMAELNSAIVVGIGESAGEGEVWRIGNPANPVPNPISVKVYQKSATVGRGYAGNGQISY